MSIDYYKWMLMNQNKKEKRNTILKTEYICYSKQHRWNKWE